jgi:prepilin-type N-terminal cleavage/methylation domain-containing protein
MKKQNAYSLVELLIVMFVFSIFAVLVAQSIALTIRGNKKSESISQIKQNLDYTLNVMSREMRNASIIDLANCSGGSLPYYNNEGVLVSFSCNESNPDDKFIEHSELGRLTGSVVQVVNCGEVFDCVDDLNVIVNIIGNDKSSGVIGASHSASTQFLIRK